jgi:hypothetical protein
VKQPGYMSFLWAIVRPFMSKKMRQRVHFLGHDVAAFHEFIDPEVGAGAGWRRQVLMPGADERAQLERLAARDTPWLVWGARATRHWEAVVVVA